VGDLSIDASDVQVTDITAEQIQKLSKVRDCFEPIDEPSLGRQHVVLAGDTPTSGFERDASR
jgi:hypothetical protein